jgi:hypothetical protein
LNVICGVQLPSDLGISRNYVLNRSLVLRFPRDYDPNQTVQPGHYEAWWQLVVNNVNVHVWRVTFDVGPEGGPVADR